MRYLLFLVIACGGSIPTDKPTTTNSNPRNIYEGGDCSSLGEGTCVEDQAFFCVRWYHLVGSNIKFSLRPGTLAWVQEGPCVK